MRDDLISRQAAIDAFEALDWYHQNINKDMVSGANPAEHQAWYKADDVYKTIEEVPSVQPDDYARGYNDAKREIALSGEYERAYQRGKEDAQQWIPCSKKLPKKSGQYYVSGGDKVWICEFLAIPNFTSGWCNDVSNPAVQAWMPLPEPYKGEQA